MDKIITNLRARREALLAQAEQIVGRAKAAGRPMSELEKRRFDGLTCEIDELDERIAELEAKEQRAAEAAAAIRKLEAGRSYYGQAARVTREPVGPYRPDARHSYFADLAAATLRGDFDARGRLAEHKLATERALGIEHRDLSRTDGAGGEFVPPLWLMDEYAAFARAGRVTADLCRRLPLPPGTDSINVPRVTGGTAVGAQSDNQAVTETDMTTGSVSAPVNTIAGQQDVSLQLVEQSPAGIDRIILGDLIAAYNAELDRQVINGSGTAPEHRGILNVSGINSVTYTDTTPTVAEAYPKIADALNRVATNRFEAPTAIVMHPRRWAWFSSALDSQNRPLVVPAAGAVNPLAVAGEVAAEGAVGTLLGLPVYADANIPTDRGAGTNEDVIIVCRFSDVLLFENEPPRTRVLPEVGSGTLTVRFQLYNYSAFMPARYPSAIATVGGTGLVAPTF